MYALVCNRSVTYICNRSVTLNLIFMKKPLGKLSKQNDGYRVEFDREFQLDSKTVWKAITDPASLTIWFMKMDIDFREGGQIVFHFGDPDNSLSYGKITRIVPGRVFEYLWLNEDGPDELAQWEVIALAPNRSRLKLTYSRVSDAYRAKASAGFHIMLNRLEEVLEGRTQPYGYTGGQSEEELEMVKRYEQLAQNL